MPVELFSRTIASQVHFVLILDVIFDFQFFTVGGSVALLVKNPGFICEYPWLTLALFSGM